MVAGSQSTWFGLGSFFRSQGTTSKVLQGKKKNKPKKPPLHSVQGPTQVRSRDRDPLYLFQITTSHSGARLPAVCLNSALSIFARHTSNNTDPILTLEPNLYHVF